MDVIDKKKADPARMAEAMYWCGDAHMKASQPDSKVNAYRMFKRLTWDYPESPWAKYARGRLSESVLAGMDKGDGR
jgi:outer membrane protein assembly factor BamD (BamD/ComL family)